METYYVRVIETVVTDYKVMAGSFWEAEMEVYMGRATSLPMDDHVMARTYEDVTGEYT
jgi:hypothetical protein